MEASSPWSVFCSLSYDAAELTFIENVSKNIESKLMGAKAIEETEETSELDRLLVRKALNEIEVEKNFGRIRFRFYIPILVAAFIVLGLVLFVFMK